MFKVFYENDGLCERVVLKESRDLFFGFYTVWDEISSLPVNRDGSSSLVGMRIQPLMALLWHEYSKDKNAKYIAKQEERKFNYWVKSLK